MHIRFILAVAVLGLLIYLIRNIRKQEPEQRPRLLIKYSLWMAAAAILLLVVFGKLHWITAGIAAIIPLGYKLFSVAMRALPIMQFFSKRRQQQNQNAHSSSAAASASGKMTLEQAQEIFGLKSVNNIEEVTKRHRELMQKMHPDRGGSDFLAAQINQAKDTLIEHVKRQS